MTSEGKGERPPAVALLIGWGVGYNTGGSDATCGVAQDSTRVVPVEVKALRSGVWKRAKLRGGRDYGAGVRNEGGIVVVGV